MGKGFIDNTFNRSSPKSYRLRKSAKFKRVYTEGKPYRYSFTLIRIDISFSLLRVGERSERGISVNAQVVNSE